MKILRVTTKFSPILFFAGVGILIFGSIPRESGASLFLPSLIIGAFLMFFSAIVSMRDLKNRLLRHIARCEIRSRSDSLVSPNESDARFVEIVPKANWNVRGLPENATDVGFLTFDFQAGISMFEGDQERYRIPSGALLDCKQDFYSRSVTLDKYGAKQDIKFYFAVINVRLSGDKVVEIPFRIRIGNGLFTNKNQQNGNASLLKDFERLKNESANSV